MPCFNFITLLIIRVKPNSITSQVEGKAVETSMLGTKPIDLPGALLTDTMRREPEHSSPTVDDCHIVHNDKIG